MSIAKRDCAPEPAPGAEKMTDHRTLRNFRIHLAGVGVAFAFLSSATVVAQTNPINCLNPALAPSVNNGCVDTCAACPFVFTSAASCTSPNASVGVDLTAPNPVFSVPSSITSCTISSMYDCRCPGQGYGVAGTGAISQSVQINCVDANNNPYSNICNIWVVDNTAPVIACDNTPVGCGDAPPANPPCTVTYAGCYTPPSGASCVLTAATNSSVIMGAAYGSFTPVAGDTFTCSAQATMGAAGSPMAQTTFTMYAPTSSTNDTSIVMGPEVTLWPPNHKYHTVTLKDCVAKAWDTCANAPLDVNRHGKILYVTSDEVEYSTAVGAGHTCNDILINNNSSVQ